MLYNLKYKELCLNIFIDSVELFILLTLNCVDISVLEKAPNSMKQILQQSFLKQFLIVLFILVFIG